MKFIKRDLANYSLEREEMYFPPLIHPMFLVFMENFLNYPINLR